MKVKEPYCGNCGQLADSSLEMLKGFAQFEEELSDDGELKYSGTTDVLWDTQQPVGDFAGEGGAWRVKLSCPDAHTWMTEVVTG